MYRLIDMIAISLALAFKEDDQSGNQQAQMSLCLFLFCRFSKGKNILPFLVNIF